MTHTHMFKGTDAQAICIHCGESRANLGAEVVDAGTLAKRLGEDEAVEIMAKAAYEWADIEDQKENGSEPGIPWDELKAKGAHAEDYHLITNGLESARVQYRALKTAEEAKARG